MTMPENLTATAEQRAAGASPYVTMSQPKGAPGLMKILPKGRNLSSGDIRKAGAQVMRHAKSPEEAAQLLSMLGITAGGELLQ